MTSCIRRVHKAKKNFSEYSELSSEEKSAILWVLGNVFFSDSPSHAPGTGDSGMLLRTRSSQRTLQIGRR